MKTAKCKMLIVEKPRGFSRTYEIFDGTTSFGGLVFRNWGYSAAEAATSQGSWLFSAKGSVAGFGQKVAAVDAKTGETVGVVEPRGLGVEADLIYKSMPVAVWRQSNWYGTRYAWVLPDGTELMRFRLKFRWKCYAEIEVLPEGECRVDYLFLLFLGVYKLKLTEVSMVVTV